MTADTQGRDFGWRLHGRSVGVLAERSFKLVPSESADGRGLGSVLGNLSVLQACLQCGTCTANCSLVGEHSQFPRRQMNLFQLGQHERLMDDPTAWHCYNCGDCSTRCPFRGEAGKADGGHPANGGRALCLSGIRGSVCQSTAAMVADVCRGGGVRARRHRAGGGRSGLPPTRFIMPACCRICRLNIFFSTLTGLAITGLAMGASRAWGAYQGQSLWQASPGRFLRALGTVSRRRAGPPPVRRLCRRSPATTMLIWACSTDFWGWPGWRGRRPC